MIKVSTGYYFEPCFGFTFDHDMITSDRNQNASAISCVYSVCVSGCEMVIETAVTEKTMYMYHVYPHTTQVAG